MVESEYCLFFATWWPMCMKKAEWAAWVGAVGTLVAIAVTERIARRQSRLLAIERRESAAERISSIVRLLIAYKDALATWCDVGRNGGVNQRTVAIAQFEDIGRSLLDLPLDSMPSELCVAAIMDCRRIYREMLFLVERVGHGGAFPVEIERVESWVGDTSEWIMRLRAEAARARDGLPLSSAHHQDA